MTTENNKKIIKISKNIQVYFPEENTTEYNYCMATIRKVQAKENANGNKCRILDAIYILCKYWMDNYGEKGK